MNSIKAVSEAVLTAKSQSVGVFVNETLDEILKIKRALKLDLIQLHGDESIAFCKEVQAFSKIIKVFKVDNTFDFNTCLKYGFSDYFLFDRKGDLPGGNGEKFDWNQLGNYDLNTPFFLSGGITIHDISRIK